jgi:hypothetical protein
MKLFPPDVLKDLVELGIMTLTALWGLTYGWHHLRVQLANGTFPLWRRTLVIIGLLAVSVQALLFALSWARLGRGNILFGQWERWFAPTFFLAVPCVLFAKGATRWWLLSSSILFFVMCFLFTLTA